MDIEIGRGLAEARTLASTHWRPLMAYMLLGVVLPYLLLASEPVLSIEVLVALALVPEDFRFTGSIAGPLYLLGICAALLCGAMLALWSALLAEIREGYIAEIMYGMVAGAAYLIAGLLFYYLIGFLLALPFRLTVGMEAARADGTPIAIARQIVRAQGGEIGVESAPGQGSRFWFSLPVAAAQPGAPPGPIPPVDAATASGRSLDLG